MLRCWYQVFARSRRLLYAIRWTIEDCRRDEEIVELELLEWHVLEPFSCHSCFQERDTVFVAKRDIESETLTSILYWVKDTGIELQSYGLISHRLMVIGRIGMRNLPCLMLVPGKHSEISPIVGAA